MKRRLLLFVIFGLIVWSVFAQNQWSSPNKLTEESRLQIVSKSVQFGDKTIFLLHSNHTYILQGIDNSGNLLFGEEGIKGCFTNTNLDLLKSGENFILVYEDYYNNNALTAQKFNQNGQKLWGENGKMIYYLSDYRSIADQNGGIYIVSKSSNYIEVYHISDNSEDNLDLTYSYNKEIMDMSVDSDNNLRLCLKNPLPSLANNYTFYTINAACELKNSNNPVFNHNLNLIQYQGFHYNNKIYSLFLETNSSLMINVSDSLGIVIDSIQINSPDNGTIIEKRVLNNQGEIYLALFTSLNHLYVIKFNADLDLLWDNNYITEIDSYLFLNLEIKFSGNKVLCLFDKQDNSGIIGKRLYVFNNEGINVLNSAYHEYLPENYNHPALYQVNDSMFRFIWTDLIDSDICYAYSNYLENANLSEPQVFYSTFYRYDLISQNMLEERAVFGFEIYDYDVSTKIILKSYDFSHNLLNVQDVNVNMESLYIYSTFNYDDSTMIVIWFDYNSSSTCNIYAQLFGKSGYAINETPYSLGVYNPLWGLYSLNYLHKEDADYLILSSDTKAHMQKLINFQPQWGLLPKGFPQYSTIIEVNNDIIIGHDNYGRLAVSKFMENGQIDLAFYPPYGIKQLSDTYCDSSIKAFPGGGMQMVWLESNGTFNSIKTQILKDDGNFLYPESITVFDNTDSFQIFLDNGELIVVRNIDNFNFYAQLYRFNNEGAYTAWAHPCFLYTAGEANVFNRIIQTSDGWIFELLSNPCKVQYVSKWGIFYNDDFLTLPINWEYNHFLYVDEVNRKLELLYQYADNIFETSYQLAPASGTENTSLPEMDVKLYQNYPNPFNPKTKICFSLIKSQKAEIAIYNIKGQRVKTLCNEQFDKGLHSLEWDGKDHKGKDVASGVYFYRLKSDKAVLNKKMLLLK